MISFVWFYLFVSFSYFHINIYQLGYFGIFTMSLVVLFISSNLLLYNIYNFWKNNYSVEFYIFNWVDFSNNLLINCNLKETLLNSILSFIMLFGAYIVTYFVYIDMSNDKEGFSFIIILGYFIVSMLIVIISNNLILFYLGWEGISLTSYFLVNYWSERVRSIKAVFKIFLISKIGDYFLIILICLIISNFGTVDFDHIHSIYLLFLNKKYTFFFLKLNVIDVLSFFLLFGTAIKSAQYGFHIWLLEAMEAPLGASALMHSSTLVIAGVVLLFKLSFIIELSNYSIVIMFFLGSMSSFFGSFFACFQYELKTILAYSTISNMGYIFIMFSISLYSETIITIILHAFIKIYMFLVIGGIIYHCNGMQDSRWMGGLLLYTPFLWSAFFIGGLSLIGIPYFSSYTYKLYIINSLLNNYIFFSGCEFILVMSYFFTFFYISRLGYIIFFSTKNGHKIIYKIKNISILYYIHILLLGFIISFSSNFWQTILSLNYYNLTINIFNNNSLNYNPFLNDIFFFTGYIWYIIYMLIFIVLFIYLILNLNTYWSFIKNWFFILNIINTIFIYSIF